MRLRFETARRGMSIALLALGLSSALTSLAAPPEGEAGPADAPREQFRALGASYIAEYAAAHPVIATEWGLHAHDARLREMAASDIVARAVRVEAMLQRLARIDRQALRGSGPVPEPEYLDHRMLEYALRNELLELRDIRGWQRNPLLYNAEIASGLALLVDRSFAPLDQRLESLIARCDQVPRIVAAARANLRAVPALWARLGARLTRGTAAFMRDELASGLAAQGLAAQDAGLVERWRAAHARALSAVDAFATWQEEELVPVAQGDDRLGSELLQRRLSYGEHVSESIEQLRQMNEAAIRDYQDRVRVEAARIDPEATPATVMEAITADFPAPERLLDTAREMVGQARRFVVERRLLSLPSDDVPLVRATPPYARGGFASMSTPGPFETVATEAYYDITLPDPSWDAARVREHMTYFNRPGLLGITVHEAFPGHFVQLLHQKQLPSDLRRVLQPATLVEGWAHYTEQMMVDEGFGDGDPRVRLGQLRRALQRHARWYASLALHAERVPLDEVVRRFQQIAYFAEFPARREVERGTLDAAYLYYALGRTQILELRADLRERSEASGQAFSLRDFHDRFLRLGLPAALAREALFPPVREAR